MAKIQIYGDSILRGVTLNEETQRYYINDAIGIDALAKDIHAEVANFSKFGCTVQKGIHLVQNNLEKGAVCDYALVEYGGNDSDLNRNRNIFLIRRWKSSVSFIKKWWCR